MRPRAARSPVRWSGRTRPHIGADVGVLAGLGPLGVTVTNDPLDLIARSDAILDFTSPAATVEFAGLAANARIVHVIGTTGLSEADDARIAAAARHAPIIKAGNMSLGVNLLAAITRRVAEALDEDYDIEILEMHHRHKVDAPSGTALMLAEAAALGRGIKLEEHHRPRPRRHHRPAPARGHRHGEPARRQRRRRAQGHPGRPRASGSRSPTSPATAASSRAGPSRRRCGAAARRRGYIPCPTCWGSMSEKCSRPARHVTAKDNAGHTQSLVLVRHGESEWNRRNLFTGWHNPDLTEKGLIEALVAGRLLKSEGLSFDIGFTSMLKRAQRTLEIILSEVGQPDTEIHCSEALNERHYGDLCGLNKDEARERWGEEKVQLWRRSYDVPPPGGESLKDTAERVIPYYREEIWPELKAGKSVIVSAHGNSLRALIMEMEGLSAEEILDYELATGAPIAYRLSSDGVMTERRDLLPARSPAAPPEDIV